MSGIGTRNLDRYMLMWQSRTLSLDQGGQVKVSALSTYVGNFNLQQALQANFRQHISKPVEPEALVRTISTLLVGKKSPFDST